MGNTHRKEKLLVNACRLNNFEEIKELLESGNNINIHYNYEDALWQACYNNNTKIVKYLLDYSIEHNTMIDMKLYKYKLCGIAYGENRIHIMKYVLEYYEKYICEAVENYFILKYLLSSCEICTMLLDHRFRMKKPFNIENQEQYLYDCYNRTEYNETYKILFEYGEKMNYKLNIRNLDMYRPTNIAYNKYLKYLDKHNYYNYSRYNKANRPWICITFSIHKKIKEFERTFHKCIYMEQCCYCIYIYNNTKIYNLEYFNKELYNIDYMLYIPTE